MGKTINQASATLFLAQKASKNTRGLAVPGENSQMASGRRKSLESILDSVSVDHQKIRDKWKSAFQSIRDGLLPSGNSTESNQGPDEARAANSVKVRRRARRINFLMPFPPQGSHKRSKFSLQK